VKEFLIFDFRFAIGGYQSSVISFLSLLTTDD